MPNSVLHLRYEHDHRVSVTLVDCDYIVQQKVEVGTWRDGYIGVVATCTLKPTRIVVSWDPNLTEKDRLN